MRQWGPWRALDGKYGSHIHPCVSEASLKAIHACLGLWLVVIGLIATPKVLLVALTRLWLPTTHPIPSPYMCNLWYYSGCEKVAQNPAVLASYYWWSWNTSQNTALVIQQIIQHGYNLVQENHGGTASILQIGISQNVIRDIMVGFPKSGHK